LSNSQGEKENTKLNFMEIRQIYKSFPQGGWEISSVTSKKKERNNERNKRFVYFLFVPEVVVVGAPGFNKG
jgi:hypothetical protein